MSVIINEFEVIMETPAKVADGKAQRANSRPAPLVAPQDIRNIIRYQAERAGRIHAH